MTHSSENKQHSKNHTHMSNYKKALMSIYNKKKSWEYLSKERKIHLQASKAS